MTSRLSHQQLSSGSKHFLSTIPMTQEELEILCEAETRLAIERNIERKHHDVALDKSLCHSSLVATQVKYLQRARTKLPSLYEARCIIPPRAFEQSSSEAAAGSKELCGESLLELTCGLGVDTLTLSKSFRRVVTLERDTILAEVARENFRRLGIENIEVVTTSAEEYLRECRERFDWIYADPDRRGAKGEKRVLLEDCSPNVLALRENIERVAKRTAIKLSPLFDVDEAFRLYPNSSVEVVSVGDECKEVVIYTGGETERVGAYAVECGGVWLERDDKSAFEPPRFDPLNYDRLLIPNVALQKGRIARRVLSEVADIWSDNGYALSSSERVADIKKNHHLAKVYNIAWIGKYETKCARQELVSRGVTKAVIMKREFPHSIDRITKQLKIKEGGVDRIAFTTIGGEAIMIILERE